MTTILGYAKEPGGLIHWAWRCGMEGRDYRQERDAAGDVGHEAHALMDWAIRTAANDNEARAHAAGASEGASKALDAFLAWRAQVRLVIVRTETPLVSELHEFGGTYDALALCDGAPVLLDWKTGNAIHTEFLAQMGAYRQLLRETTPAADRHLVPTGACLLRVGKEFGDFHYHAFPEAILDLGWERFRASHWLYLTDRQLKKAV